jgi:Cu/Ag efflux pump CusA
MATKSIRRPIALLLGCLFAACVLAAVGAYLFLQRWGRGSPRPGDSAAATMVVVAAYPGSSAEEVERQVTIPLEVTFAGTPGLRSTRSKSLFGLAQLRLEFESRVNYDQARQEVINRLALIAQPLPEGVTPQLSVFTAGHDILRYTLAGPRDARGKDVYTPADLRALQDWVLEREFRRVSGVIDIEGTGGAVRRFEVHLDPDRLRRYGVTLRQLQNALAESNANVGGDFVAQGAVALNVRGVGLFGGGEDPVQRVLGLKDPRQAAARLRAEEQRRLHEIRSLVIATVNAVPVRLEDVVEGGPLAPGDEGSTRGVLVGRRPRQIQVGLARPGEPDEDNRVLGVVLLRPDEDRSATLDRVKAKVQEINDTPGRLLPGVRIEPLWERGDGAAEDLLILQAGFPAGISSKGVAVRMRQARAILLHYPEVRAILSQFGQDETGSDPVGTESGQLLALLHPGNDPRHGRRELADAVRAELARMLAGTDWDILPDGVDDFQAAFVATPGAGLLKIYGPNLGELERLAGKAEAELRQLAGVAYAHIRHVLGRANLEFRVDPDKCARWGVRAADVNNAIALAVGGQRATQVVEGEKTFDLTLLWTEPHRRSEESILDIPMDVLNAAAAPGGVPEVGQVPPIAAVPRLRLRDLVSPRGADGEPDPIAPFVRPGAAAIWREQGRRLIAVRFGIRDRDEADGLAEARVRLASMFQVPYSAEWSGGRR